MSLFGRLWFGRASYAADGNPYRATLGHVTVEAVRTFNALLNTFSKTFDFRYDEAMRVDPDFAMKMKRDPYLKSLLQERFKPLTRWKWKLTPPDPKAKDQLERAAWYEAVLKKTPHFSKQKYYLGWGAGWYGRYASQFSLVDDRVQGKKCKRVGRHFPVNGDKIVFDWDGVTPGVRINYSVVRDFPKENITYDNRGGPILMLRDPAHRSQFIIHVHELDDADYFEPEMAGRVCGVGLRDFAYYGAYLRQKMIQWAVAFMEKVGTLGLLIFYYPEGNAQARAQAELSAKQSSNRNALAIPIPKGGDKKTSSAELLPANMTGVQFLVDIISGWWERNIERLFVGQSMSAGADDESGLGGSGRAELAKDTKFNLLNFDARGEEESYTTDLMPTLEDANGDAGFGLTFEYVLPDPEAEPKLNAITKAATLPGKKLTYKASEVRELTGMSEPGPDDEIVGGEDPLGPGVGADGMPLPGAEALSGVSADERSAKESEHKMAHSDRELEHQIATAGKEGAGGKPGTSSGGVPDDDDAADTGEEGDDADRWADPHPESEALLLAMIAAADEGDEQALADLGELAADPDGFADLLADMDGGEPSAEEAAYFAHLATVPYGWTAGASKRGGVKAVGNGPHAGKTLYGKQAEAALRGQQKKANPEPTKKDRAKADAGERRTKKAAAVEGARGAVKKATESPASLSGEELAGLAQHLATLTVAQMKGFAKEVKAKVSGKKQELADRILSYVKTQATAKAEPKKEEPKSEPKAEPKAEPEPKKEEPLELPDEEVEALSLDDSDVAAKEFTRLSALNDAGKLNVSDYANPLVRAHVEHLNRLPAAVHDKLVANGLGGVYFGSATVPGLDSMAHLAGVQPRGWDEGDTWDKVPAAYNYGRRNVMAGGGRHASASAALHEYGHAVGDILGLNDDPELVAWHERLHPSLCEYLQQDGPGGRAGRQELVAECFAQYWMRGWAGVLCETKSEEFADWFREKMQNLGDPGTVSYAWTEPHAPEGDDGMKPSFGPKRLPDGRIAVPRRAVSDDGETVGMAMLPIGPDDPDYARYDAQLKAEEEQAAADSDTPPGAVP